MFVAEHWVVVDVNQPEVVGRDKKCSVVANVHTVNVRAVLTLRVNSEDVPAKLECLSCPDSVLAVLHACGVVHLVSDVEVKLLVVAARRTDVRRIRRPVQRLDV